MRQYRGLTKEGKLVYGWYCHVKEHKYWSGVDKQSVAPERHFIIQDDSEYTLDHIEPYYVYDVSEAIEVIPETIGQSIGLKDKNGTGIYEGDIVTTPRYKCKAKLQIYWNKETAAFEGLHPAEIGGSECFDEITEPEVIGNIFQNKDLLDETKKTKTD